MKSLPRVLVVNDNPVTLNTLAQLLSPLDDQFEFHYAEGGANAFEALEQDDFAVVAADLDNRNLDGAEFFNRLRTQFPMCARIVLSSHADTARPYHLADDDGLYLSTELPGEMIATALARAVGVHDMLLEHPRGLNMQELTEVIVDYFTREIMHNRITLADIPKRIRPYIPKQLLEQANHYAPEFDEVPPEQWTFEEDWTAN